MVGAWSEGEPLDSTDVDESISKHTGSVRSFAFNLTAAQKSTAGNPFVGANAVPAEISGGGAANNTDNDDDEGAASDKYAFLSTGVAAAVLMTGLSLGTYPIPPMSSIGDVFERMRLISTQCCKPMSHDAQIDTLCCWRDLLQGMRNKSGVNWCSCVFCSYHLCRLGRCDFYTL